MCCGDLSPMPVEVSERLHTPEASELLGQLGSGEIALITGGSGWLGQRLAEQLLCSGRYEQVVLVDLRPPTGDGWDDWMPPINGPSCVRPTHPAGSAPAPQPAIILQPPAPVHSTCGHVTRRASLHSCQPSAHSALCDTSVMPHQPGSPHCTCRVYPHAAMLGRSAAAQKSSTAAGMSSWQSRCTFKRGDVTNPDDLRNACAGVSAVFHLASYGMSGAESLAGAQRIYDINVCGTHNLIEACIACGVPKLVYVSTVNVVFDHTPKLGLDESNAPYINLATGFSDPYSITKMWAEQLVVAANGVPLAQPSPTCSSCPASACSSPSSSSSSSSLTLLSACAASTACVSSEGVAGHGSAASCAGCGSAGGVGEGARCAVFHTCSIRPPGIWGPGEQRHFPRILQHARSGLLKFSFGCPVNSKSDWVHVDNLVQALVRASDALGPQLGHVAAGQCYFVSDPQGPIHNFEFIEPLLKALGYPAPSIRLPGWLVHGFCKANEFVAALAAPLVRIPVPLCAAEVAKVTVPHHFQISKARQELGYDPCHFTSDIMAESYRALGLAAPATLQLAVTVPAVAVAAEADLADSLPVGSASVNLQSMHTCNLVAGPNMVRRNSFSRACKGHVQDGSYPVSRRSVDETELQSLAQGTGSLSQQAQAAGEHAAWSRSASSITESSSAGSDASISQARLTTQSPPPSP